MFENLLFQGASSQLSEDLKNNRLPNSILLAGPEASGKLTCALELGRILSCSGTEKYGRGHWLCDCPSCKKNKELSSTNIIVAGPRDCSLEILAAKKTLLYAGSVNASYMNAARYLFIRAVRKLTLRFSPVLWEGDNNISKIAPLMEEINDQLEKLNPELTLPENNDLEKICEKILTAAEKLESNFMYDSLPIDHIRHASFWAHMKSGDGKKVLIIENAEKMNESCRNALLKILEEPPSDVIFILTTSRRGAVMPTILSRVRTYTFAERTPQQQSTVIDRVFHDKKDIINIQEYLQTFLPVTPAEVKKQSAAFYDGIKNNHLIQVSEIVKACKDFEPRSMFKIFLNGIVEVQRSDAIPEVQVKNLEAVRDCYSNVITWNQKPLSALEKLYRDLASIRKVHSK